MPARRGPTYLRVMLGKELRTLRERAGLTAEAVSVDLGFSRSKVSRVEGGDIPLPKLSDLEKLMDKYEVTDPDDRDALLAMQRESLSREPFTSYRQLMPSGTPLFLGLERDANRVRAYENWYVHGLLQAESYARAMMRTAKVVEERTTDFTQSVVRARMDRKEDRIHSAGPEVHIIMAESALRTLVGSAEVMREQYEEILRISELDHVDIQIIPEAMATYRSGWNFEILEFDTLGPVASSDSHKATTIWSRESDVGQYQRQFEAMAKAAPGPAQTPQILRDLEKKLWT